MIRDRLASLTVTPLLYAIGGLLLVCIALGVRTCSLSKDVDVAVAAQGTAEAERDTAATERDAWKGKAEGAVAANAAYGVVLDEIRAQQARDAQQAAAAAAQAAQQVAAAQAGYRKAEGRLTEYRRVFGDRPADCESALQAMQRACPLLEGY